MPADEFFSTVLFGPSFPEWLSRDSAKEIAGAEKVVGTKAALKEIGILI